MIQQVLKDDAFLADVRAGNCDNDDFRLWWLGQSGFLVQWKRSHLLLDPYLSDSLTKKYAATDKPHIRMTERIIDPSRLNLSTWSLPATTTPTTSCRNARPAAQGQSPDRHVAPAANRDFIASRLVWTRRFPSDFAMASRPRSVLSVHRRPRRA